MNILFVSSGKNNTPKTIVLNQAKSLIQTGNNIEFFIIDGNGLIGYLNHYLRLRKRLKNTHYEIIHAHYSFSAYLSSIALANPLVVSLMGSDVKSGSIMRASIKIFNWLFRWNKIIVKSEDMKKNLGLNDIEILPNGVNLDLFKPMDKLLCQKELAWDSGKIHILFAANPELKVKNFNLTKNAINLINNPLLELHTFNNIEHDQIPIWLNTSDIVILTSLWEGSPNVIKEAMACNRPIVATNVGDVNWVTGNTEGCYLTTFDPNDVAEKIKLALKFSEDKGKTKGRERIMELGLDSEKIAKRIIEVYKKVLIRNGKKC